MPVNQISSSGDGASQEAEAKALADNILDNFELPESLAKKINETEKETSEEEEVTETEETETEASAESETSSEPESNEDSQEQESDSEEEEAEDEELIPKSKFQKRLDEMTREKRLLEARLRKLEEAGNSTKPVDEDLLKLEKMTESELVALKKQVRVSQIKSASDEATLNKLLELEEKIDSVARTAPQRFQQNQVSQFNEAVQMSASEIQDFQKHQKDIFGLAKRIYDTAPELHASVSGQARAWNLAVEHFKLLQESKMGKTKIEELNREKNTLKKKVSGNSVSKKPNVSEQDSDNKLFKRAKGGELRDKLEFIRRAAGTDAIVDGFMDSRR